MAFFIDFEATQFSEKIISVGCVNEYGFSYYSLVYSGKEQIIDKNKIQVHNALDDAVMLKNIYQYCGSNRNLNMQLQDFKQLSERQTASQKYTKLELPVGTICIINEKKRIIA